MSSTSTSAYHKRNLSWPVSRSGGRFSAVTLVKRYETALKHLAATPRGSYYVDPDYGTMTYRLRTQGLTEALVEAALEDLRRGAAKYIPDIQIHDVRAQVHEDKTWLVLSIFWTLRGATQQMHGNLADQQVLALQL